jgi:FMN phosphatase YigB (HAD superfamily)
MKPDAKIYLNVPAFFKISPEECAYVTDEVEDLRVVKNLGMSTIFIPGESKSYEEADYYYPNIQEFLEILA